MSVLSIVLLLPIAYFAYKGFRRGLVVELCSLIALILGVFITISFSDITYNILKENFPNLSNGLSILSYVLTFVLVVILVRIMAKLVTKIVDSVALGFINKTLGALFGAFKAILFLALLSILYETVNNQYNFYDNKNTDESTVYTVVQYTGAQLQTLFSDNYSFTSPIKLN